MKPLLTVLAGLLGIALLGGLCTSQHRPAFEADLSAKTVSALNNPGVRVTALGQIMTLEGEVPDEAARERAGELARSVYGVAEVRNLLTVKVAAGGAVTMTPAERSAAVNCQSLFDGLLKENIRFATARSVIDPSSYPLLNKLADAARTCPAARIEVGGHTDPRGAMAMNMKLSEERAASVVAYLVGRGLEAGRLTSAGYGPTKPIAGNDTAAGMAQNRRTEFKVKGL
ncbi:MAG: OmpA family protein [Bryobacteraceae bacterium]|nr:OmpA family protein [Bryobacteraceae bacterium]